MAISFNAVNQWINLGQNLPYLNGAVAATAMLWVNLRSNPIAGMPMFAIAIGPPPGTTTTSRFSFNMSPGMFPSSTIRNADTDASSTPVVSTVAVALGVWSHVALVYNCNSRQASTYINGVITGTGVAVNATGTSFSATNTKCAAIASEDDGSATFFDGMFDDVRLYSRILSAGEISTIAAARGGDGILAELQCRYPLNELGIGQTAVQCPSIASFFATVGIPTNGPVYSAGVLRGSRSRRNMFAVGI